MFSVEKRDPDMPAASPLPASGVRSSFAQSVLASRTDRGLKSHHTAIDLAGIVAAVALFCTLGLSHLGLPGLYQDEALDVAPAARLLRGESWPYALCPSSVALPLMVCDHVGPTSTYLMLPFLSGFGINLTAVRVYEFAVGLAALALTFLFARRVLPRGTAWIAALLLAAMPSFWLACRNGLHVSFVVVPLAAGALVCFDRWCRERQSFWFHVGCFLLGVGVSTKILFIWFVAALLVGVLVVEPRLLRRLSGRQVGAGLAWFVAGCAPFLAFIVLSRGLTLRTILANLTTTSYGVSNTAFPANLWTQLHSFARILNGGWLDWTGVAPRNWISPGLFALSAAYLLTRGRRPELHRLHLSLVAVVVIVLASCFTITTLGPKHLVLLLPFLTVVVAGAIGTAWKQRARPASLAVLLLLAILCAAQFAWDLGNDYRYLRSLAVTGGTGLFSSANNRLSEYLVAHRIRQPLAGDWGFDSNLEVLSRGNVRVRQVFELAERPPFAFTRQQVRSALRDADSVYLFHAPSYAAAPGRLEAFLAEARDASVALAPAVSFRDGLGRPVIVLYSRKQSRLASATARGREGAAQHALASGGRSLA